MAFEDGEEKGATEGIGAYRDGNLLKSSLLVVAVAIGLTLTLGVVSRMVGPVAGVQLHAAVASAPGAAPKQTPNTLTYRADGSGHFFVDAMVNGTPVRFMIDTGATVVALTPDDALAVGIPHASLHFSETVNTANGTAKVARISLREVRLGQLSLDEVPAVVMEQPMPVSLLGMSFLKRLDGYSIRDGVLTIDW